MAISMVAELNERMLEISRKQLSEKGEKDGGLYKYYTDRINKGKMLSSYELFAIEYVEQNFPKHSSIIEPASGIGTLSHALYLLGFENVTSCEHDSRRYAANVMLGAHLNTKVKIISDNFPSSSLADFDLVIMTNAQSTNNSFAELLQYIKETRADVIFMPRLWEVSIDYKQGCDLLTNNGINYIELGHEMVHINKGKQ